MSKEKQNKIKFIYLLTNIITPIRNLIMFVVEWFVKIDDKIQC